MKILIVEDDRALAEIFARNLRACGYTTNVVDCGEAAILNMAEEWPDTLILDVNLPDFSAWEILRRLGEEDRRQLKVIVISAAPISPRRIGEFKPYASLQKPFPLRALLNAIEGAREDPDPEERTEVVIGS